MSRFEKTLERILRGNADANLRFAELCGVLQNLGFTERIRGAHHIFTRDGVPEIINLQPRDGKAKLYQVKQVRELIVRHGLAGGPKTETSGGEQGDRTEPDSTTLEDVDGK